MFLRLCQNEPDTIEWINNLPPGPITLWDIGANVGCYSLLAALRPDVRVLAFEPAAASYRLLNENIELNAMDDRITALPVAFCAETKIDSLNMAVTNAGSSMHGFGIEVDQFGEAIDTRFRQGAISYSIDDFVRTYRPKLPTCIKIDVDGLEPDILRGGRDTLSSSTVRTVILEVEGNETRSRELVEMMSTLGFLPRPKGPLLYRNIVFDRQDKASGSKSVPLP